MKIDKNGHYVPFPGVTVIAPIPTETMPFWNSVHTKLAALDLLSEYFTLLPYSSYHMTTNNLYVAEGEHDWTGLIDIFLPKLQRMHHRLMQCAFTPTPRIHSFIDKGAIQLHFQLPKEQIALIDTIGREFDVSFGIPSSFHMTLAYQFKLMSTDVAQALHQQLQPMFDELKHSQPEIRLQMPQLHTFQDMTSYTPWDASSNPFVNENALNTLYW